MPADSSPIDIAVVGAGIAGLSAARRALEAGLRVAIFEAKDRVGGRAWTTTVGGYPIDLGATWLHSAGLNPLVPVAQRLGFEPAEGFGRSRLFVATGQTHRWGTEAELHEAIAFRATTDAAAVAAGESGRDEPVANVIPPGSRWAALYEWWIAAYTAADPEHASTLDYALYRETGENLSIPRGLGTLVATLGAGLPVELSTPVHRIRWSGQGASLDTRSGTIEASAVILTASTGALGNGSIRFDPELPVWKQEAIDAIPLGSANKVVIAFDGNPFGDEESCSVRIEEGTRRTIGMQIRPVGRNVASGYIGGSFSRELEAEGVDAMIAFAQERLRWMYGSGIAKRVTAARASSWTSDPWIAGAYSAARPGEAHRRADLSRPLGNRLFFAGEATSDGFHTTVHGGHLSGVRAADEAIAALSRR